MLTLFFKRAMIFLHITEDGASRRYNAIISQRGPVPVPDWVKETLTYQYGVKAKDILDLTPPTKVEKKKMERELHEEYPGKTEDEIADAVRAEQPPAPVGAVQEQSPEPATAGFVDAPRARGKGKAR
jgi:hypothetical protein